MKDYQQTSKINHVIKGLLSNSVNTIIITSGEGDGEGVSEVFTGRRTLRAINARLTRERFGGARWARAEVYSGYEIRDWPDLFVFCDLEDGQERTYDQTFLASLKIDLKGN